jgi:hypothetical protein
MTYEEIVAKVSEDTGLSRKLVDSTYKSYWRAVREHIKSLPLKEDLSEEEFKKLKPSVNIPSLGKLYVTYERYMKIRKQYIKNTN